MSPEWGQAGTAAAEAGNGAGCWEAAARRRAQPRHWLSPCPGSTRPPTSTTRAVREVSDQEQ